MLLQGVTQLLPIGAGIFVNITCDLEIGAAQAFHFSKRCAYQKVSLDVFTFLNDSLQLCSIRKVQKAMLPKPPEPTYGCCGTHHQALCSCIALENENGQHKPNLHKLSCHLVCIKEKMLHPQTFSQGMKIQACCTGMMLKRSLGLYLRKMHPSLCN